MYMHESRHIWMSHVTHTTESCHIRMSHVTHTNESCHTYEWVMSHIWLSHGTDLGVCVRSAARSPTRLGSQVCHMTHSYLWQNSFLRDMTLCIWRDSSIHAMSLSYVWRDSFIRAMTHTYVWCDSFKCVTCVMWLIHTRHDAFVCAMPWRHDSFAFILNWWMWWKLGNTEYMHMSFPHFHFHVEWARGGIALRRCAPRESEPGSHDFSTNLSAKQFFSNRLKFNYAHSMSHIGHTPLHFSAVYIIFSVVAWITLRVVGSIREGGNLNLDQ